MWLALAVMVFTVVAWVVEGMTRLMVNLPARSSTAPEAIPGALAQAHVRAPTARLDWVSAHRPGLDAMNPHLRGRCLAGHVMDQATPRDKTGDVVVPLRLAPASGVLGGLHPLEQIGVITFVDPAHITQIMGVEGLYVGRMRTQPVCGDTHLEVWMVLTPFGTTALGGMAFTLMVVRALLLDERFRHQRHHFTPVWMDHRRAQHLMRLGDRTVAVHLVQTRRTVHRRGGNIPRALEGQSLGPSQERHGCKRLASLQWSTDALEQGRS